MNLKFRNFATSQQLKNQKGFPLWIDYLDMYMHSFKIKCKANTFRSDFKAVTN